MGKYVTVLASNPGEQDVTFVPVFSEVYSQ